MQGNLQTFVGGFLLAGLLGVGHAGCSSSSPAGESCFLDSNCKASEQCLNGTCRPRTCTNERDCAPGKTCQDGTCTEVTGCTGDPDCNGARCETPTGLCVQCLSDSDCQGGARCVGKVCYPTCQSNPDCSNPALPVCDPQTGICVGCLQQTDCDPGELCVEKICVAAGCGSDQDCVGTATPYCKADTKDCVECLGANHCGAGKDCVGNLCVDQLLTTLTLVGKVADSPVAEATVQVSIGGKVFGTTSDAAGNYRLEIGTPDTSQLVLIRARGSQQLNQGYVELVSLPGDMDYLLSRAGQDRVLTKAEHSGTHITNLSTARYVAILEGNGGLEPANLEQLMDAEQLLNSTVGLDGMMEIAAAIRLIVENPMVNLPGGFATTLDLARDLDAVRAFITQVRETFPARDLIAEAIQETLQDQDLVADFDARAIHSNVYQMLKKRNGFIGSGGGRYDFSPEIRGSYQPQVDSFVPTLPSLTGFSWSVNSGRLTVGLDSPVDPYDGWMDTEAIAARYPGDPGLQQQIREALVNDLGANVTRELIKEEHLLVAEGVAVDCVQVTETRRLRLSEALLPFGVTAPDVEGLEPAYFVAWFHGDGIRCLPFTSELVVGTWAMELVAASDKQDLYQAIPVGEPVLTYALVTFDPDGTATASDGVISGALALQWQILADGRLQLTYPGGAEQLVGIWEVEGGEYGFVTWYFPTAGGMYSDYWRAIKADPAFALTSELLINQPDQYWQGIINIPYAEIDEAGNLDLFTIFGFDFDPGYLMTRLLVDYADPENQLGPYIYHDETWNYRVDHGQAHIEKRYDSGWQTRCTSADPSCFVYRVRRWLPVAQVGQRVYVLESDSYISDWLLPQTNEMSWDANQQAWVDSSGAPIDLSSHRYLIFPRLNAYYVDDIPIF